MAGAQAAEIAAAAQEGGAEPVGVFVEEGAAAIEAACDAAGLRTAQLHGDGARAALRTLPERLAAIYAMAVDPAAGYAIATPTPSSASRTPICQPSRLLHATRSASSCPI